MCLSSWKFVNVAIVVAVGVAACTAEPEVSGSPTVVSADSTVKVQLVPLDADIEALKLWWLTTEITSDGLPLACSSLIEGSFDSGPSTSLTRAVVSVLNGVLRSGFEGLLHQDN